MQWFGLDIKGRENAGRGFNGKSLEYEEMSQNEGKLDKKVKKPCLLLAFYSTVEGHLDTREVMQNGKMGRKRKDSIFIARNECSFHSSWVN